MMPLFCVENHARFCERDTVCEMQALPSRTLLSQVFPWTSVIHTTWELVRNAEAQPSPLQTSWVTGGLQQDPWVTCVHTGDVRPCSGFHPSNSNIVIIIMMVSARFHVRHSKWMVILFNLYRTIRFLPLCMWGNWGSEELRNLPKVTELAVGRSRMVIPGFPDDKVWFLTLWSEVFPMTNRQRVNKKSHNSDRGLIKGHKGRYKGVGVSFGWGEWGGRK